MNDPDFNFVGLMEVSIETPQEVSALIAAVAYLKAPGFPKDPTMAGLIMKMDQAAVQAEEQFYGAARAKPVQL